MQKVIQVNLLTLIGTGEPQSAAWATREHATYSILFKSYIVNTGSLLMDAKDGGE
jgi:hypothetical protein